MTPKPSVEPSFLLKEEDAPAVHIVSFAEQIYKAYPLHVAKPKAIAAIVTQIRLAGPANFASHAKMLLDKTRAFAAVTGTDLSFCPHPTTWFNQQRFNDDPSTWKRKNGTHQQGNTSSNRNLGTANEGAASEYAHVGKVR
jgi:hypothetical protein